MKLIRRGVVGDKYRPLTEESVRKIHETAMRVMEEVGFQVNSEIALELFEQAGAKVDKEQKTNLNGVFAAGDCTGGLFQVIFAVAEGAKAGINACKFLRHLKKE